MIRINLASALLYECSVAMEAGNTACRRPANDGGPADTHRTNLAGAKLHGENTATHKSRSSIKAGANSQQFLFITVLLINTNTINNGLLLFPMQMRLLQVCSMHLC